MKKNIKQENIENSEIDVSRSTSNGIFKNKNNKKGYAILFTIIIVSAISVITAGLSNATYKQLILSSLAKDSQAAFYQSDTATECALYAIWVESAKTPSVMDLGGSWSCGNSNLTVSPTADGGYTVNPTNENSPDPCFRITATQALITDSEGNPKTETTIRAKGYNICRKDNLRTVEREIEIKYRE